MAQKNKDTKGDKINLFRTTQIIIGATAILLGVLLLMTTEQLSSDVGIAFLFGIFAMMTGMRNQ
jgi:hypothetical protein